MPKPNAILINVVEEIAVSPDGKMITVRFQAVHPDIRGIAMTAEVTRVLIEGLELAYATARQRNAKLPPNPTQ